MSRHASLASFESLRIENLFYAILFLSLKVQLRRIAPLLGWARRTFLRMRGGFQILLGARDLWEVSESTSVVSLTLESIAFD